MNIERLKQYVRDCIKQHPDKADDIKDLYYLAVDEINDGGSESHECELAMESIKQLTENNEDND